MRKYSAFFWVWLFLLLAFSAIAQTPQTLNSSQPIEKAIKEKDLQYFNVQIPANHTAVIEIDQKGVDVGGTVYKGDSKEVYFEFDIPSGGYTKDVHLLTADETATYKLELFVYVNEQSAGSYTIKLAETRPTTPKDLEITKATKDLFKLYMDAQALRNKETAEGRREAIEKFEQMLPLSKIMGQRCWEGLALEFIASTQRRLGSSRKALEFYYPALKIAEEINYKSKQAFLLNQIGLTHYYLSEKKESLEALEKSLILAREMKQKEIEAGALNNLGLVYIWQTEFDKALVHFDQSLIVYRELNLKTVEATIIYNIGLAYLNQREYKKALSRFEEALAIWKELKDEEGVALILQNIGVVHHDYGDMRTALSYYQQALPIRVKSGDRRGEAGSLSSIASSYDRLGDIEKALEYYEKSLKIYRELKNNREPTTLNNLAVLMSRLGDDEVAFDLHNQALKIYQKNEDLSGESLTLGNIGSIYEFRGDLSRAREFYDESLKKVRQAKDLRTEGQTLSRFGLLEIKENKLNSAIELFTKSLEIARQFDNRRDEASNLSNLGFTANLQGDKNKALDFYIQSAKIWNSLEDKSQEAAVLYRRAKIEKELNRLSEAKKNIETAIKYIETLRTKIPTQRLRASYFATVQQYYELYIEILLQENAANSIVTAFELSERSRSRSLLELLQEARVDIRQGVDSKFLEREKVLLEVLNDKSRNLTTLLNSKTKPEPIQLAKKEIIELENELENLRTQIRKENPRYATLTQAVPLSAKEIQNLLDTDTVLLEYKLGDTRSFLWLVTKNEIKIFNLPKREEIEKLGKDFYDAVIGKGKIDELSAKLNQILFAQITTSIKNKRLAIIADGILQYLPFSAVVENETVILPSASVLAELRQTVYKPTGKTIAIFADPVFDENDTRLSAISKTTKTPKSTEIGRVLRDFNFGDNLPRLLASRFEANNISQFVPKNQADVRIDFEANRETVLRQNLHDYRILHFATHGLLDSSRPEFSGLVFSLFDEKGNAQDGFLRLNQIYNLSLQSDLVVLSACQTALGKDIRGEGLVGLTRGFMYAGAKRIVASLWKVDDAATAEFMKRFYQNLLVKNLKPANALRQTQNEMKQIPRFKSPYYWAGFTIQGDWK